MDRHDFYVPGLPIFLAPTVLVKILTSSTNSIMKTVKSIKICTKSM